MADLIARCGLEDRSSLLAAIVWGHVLASYFDVYEEGC